MRKSRVFIFIAALLVTLLMAVGCDVSPVSPSNNIVEATIAVSSNDKYRSLDFETEIGISHYEYVMIPLFDYPAGSDKIVGAVGKIENSVISGWEELPADGVVGYVTQGKWKIYLRAVGENNEELFISEREEYFTNTNKVTTMLLQPSGDGNTLVISLNQQFLSENIYEYNYLYVINGISDSSFVKTGKLVLDETNYTSFSGNYSATIDNLDAGYYSVRLLQYKNTGATGPLDESDIWYGTPVGGKGVFISLYGSQAKTISGVVDPSEFVEAQIDMNVVNVVTSLSVVQDQTDSRICNFTLVDSTVAPDGYTATYKWYVNSDEVQNTNDNPKVFNYTFSKYGKKNVTCITVYSKEESGKKYSAQGRANCEFEVNPTSV